MSNLKITFLKEEFNIPDDIIDYLDALALAEDIKETVTSYFLNKAKNKIVSAEDIMPFMEEQAKRFVKRLCDRGIFSKTVDDYIDNSGYRAVNEVSNDSQYDMMNYLQGKGLMFGIIVNGVSKYPYSKALTRILTSSIKYSELKKQIVQTDKQIKKEQTILNDKERYITSRYIPSMKEAIMIFSYNMLQIFIHDLAEAKQFNMDALNYIDINRSQSLLKNLSITSNKEAVLKSAFNVCPFNINVYIETAKAGLLDKRTFETAKIFNQDVHLIKNNV